MANKKLRSQSELLTLKNVGQATLRDLHLLGIKKIEQLKGVSADQLYHKLEILTKSRQDPYVLDVFAAIIHEAETGEKLPWWHFSRIRKQNQNSK